MIEDMQLGGLSPRAQESYARVVSQLVRRYHKSPDKLEEGVNRDYFFVSDEC